MKSIFVQRKLTSILLTGAAVLVGFMYSIALAQSPTINYQGKLTDDNGLAVADGTYDMEFSLYTEPVAGSPVWTEVLAGPYGVEVENGLFSIMLGASSSLASVDFTQVLYLGVTIEADAEMTPRKMLGTVPAAFESKTLGGVASTSFVRSDEADIIAASTSAALLTITQTGSGDVLNLFDGSTEVFSVLDGGNVGIGSSTPSAKLTVTGDGYFGGNLTATGTLTIAGNTSLQNASTTNLSILNRLYDGAGSVGTAGMVLQTTGSGVSWVATSTLGASSAFSNSSQLAALLSDETGTGSFILSNSPAFGGTATFSALSATSTFTLSGTAANIALGSNFLSGDGDDEGVFVDSTGSVGIGTTTMIRLLNISGVSNAGVMTFDTTNNLRTEIRSEDSQGFIGTFSNHDLRLMTNNTSRVTIETTGDVGIGSTTPGYKLTVVGDGYFGGNLTATGTLTIAGNSSLQNASTTNLTILNRLYDGAGSVGTAGMVLQTTGSGVSWVATSTLGASSAFSDSAGLAAILSDEQGTSGGFVRASSSMLTNPTIINASTTGLTSAGVTYLTGLTASRALFIDSLNRATTTGASADLMASLSDETGTSSLVFSNSPTLVTPNLGTPSVLTLTNATGLPVSTGITGLGTGVATFLATPSSANLVTAVTDETGSGNLVFSTSPTFTGTAIFANSTSTNLGITGTLRDSLNASGTLGMVLLSTGTSTQWVATNTLGISSGANVLNDLTDVDTTGVAAGNLLAFDGANWVDFATSSLAIGPTGLLAADFGDFTCNGTTCSFDADTVSIDEMADSDHGDFTYSGGSATLDADTVADSEIDYTNVTLGDFTNDAGYITDITGQSFLDLSDVTLGTYTANRVLFTNAAADGVADSANLVFTGTRLGVGTSTPTSTLDVWGNLTVGTSSTPQLFVDSSTGRVGIGTPTPSDTLFVNGGITAGIGALDRMGAALTVRSSTSEQYVAEYYGRDSNFAGFGVFAELLNAVPFIQFGDNAGASGPATADWTVTAENTMFNVRPGNAVASPVFTVLSGGNVGIATTTPGYKFTVVGDQYLTGTFRDSTTASGTLGMVLQATGTSTRWVATSTLGIGASFTNSSELAALLSDETGTGAFVLSSSPAFGGTATFSALTATSTVTLSGNTSLANASSTTGITLGGVTYLTNLTASRALFNDANNRATTTGTSAFLTSSISDETGSGALVFGTNPTISNASSTGGITLAGVNYFTGLTASRGLFVDSLNRATTTGTSAFLSNSLSDETGTGSFVLSSSPAFGGTATFSALTASSTVNFSGVTTFANASSTTGITFGGVTYLTNLTASRALFNDANNRATTTGTSAFLSSSLSDETGTGAFVLSSSPAFGGTATFSALTATSTVTLSGNTSITNASSTAGITIGGHAYFTNLTASRGLFVDSLNRATTTGTSAFLTSSISDETGSGNLVFSTSPTFTGTAIFANSTTTNLGVTGMFKDSVNASGTLGMVLQATGTSTRWVATSTLGIGSSFSDSAGLAAILSDEQGTSGGFVRASSSMLTNANIINASTTGLTSAGVTYLTGLTTSRGLFLDALNRATTTGASADLLASISDETGTGALVFGTNPTISNASSTGGITLAGVNYFTGLTASRGLFVDSLNRATTTGTSAFLTSSISDETGSGNLVFSTSPTFTGTAIFANSTTTNLGVTGMFKDSVNASGTLGMVLQATGTSTRWVATSTLGIGGAETLSVNDLTDGRTGGTGLFFLGTDALTSNDYTFAIGTDALDSVTSGAENFAIGINALTTVSTGEHNMAIGIGAGAGVDGGDFNLAIGQDTLAAPTNGIDNVAVGYLTLENSIGSSNTAVGAYALNALNDGDANTALGIGAGDGLGSYNRNANIYIGYLAGWGSGDNDNNILIGYRVADNLDTGSNNIIIGHDVEIASTTGNGQLNIGNLIFGTGVDGTGTTLSSGNVGIGSTTPSAKLTVTGGGYFGGNLTATGTLNVSGHSTLTSASTTNLTSSGTSYLTNLRLTGLLNDSTNASGTLGMVLQATGTSTRWVATSTLGIGGGSTYLSLTDTPSSFTANRIPFTNSGATALTDSADFVFNGTSLGIGTTTPTGRMSMQNTGFTGNGTMGITQYLQSTNSSLNAVEFGNTTNIAFNPSATSTLAGGILRITDNTTLGNTVRGLEIQAERGTNVYGENTGLSAFGRTFGVRGTTQGDAGALYEPAGVIGETNGTSQGNAIRGYSQSITSASLMQLLQEGSTFTGTGLLMDLAEGSGTFTGNFFDLQNNNTSMFTVASDGDTYIAGNVGIGTSTPSAQLTVTGGGYFGGNLTATGTLNVSGHSTLTSASTTNLTSSGTSYLTNLRLTGLLNDSTNASGTLGMVLQATGTSTRWVATSTLGISGTSFTNSSELAALLSDETGTGSFVLSSSPAFGGTATFSALTATSTVTLSGNTSITNASSTAGITIGGHAYFTNLTASRGLFVDSLNRATTTGTSAFLSSSISDETGSGALVFGTNPTISNASSTGGITLAGVNYFTNLTASRGLFVDSLNRATTTGTSAFLSSSLSDETGTGSFVLSSSPAFGGTATFAALTATSTLTLSGTAANIALGSNFLSGDGADEGLFVDGIGRIGLGTTTPTTLLTVASSSITGTSTFGTNQHYVLTNASNGAVMFGNHSYIVASNTATSTLVGDILRIVDSTTLGNTVRGLEVQAERGTNTLGENTALSGFARTFGVRGTTRGDAGGTYEPAGGYFETEGTTQGNAVRGYSDTITSASLLALFQESSVFTGTGLQMNLGNAGTGSGTFTGNFIDLQNAGTSKFLVSRHGTTTIGDGTTNNMAGLQIGYGGICVDNDGTCVASTTGRISAVSYHTGNSDLAEMYFSSQDLEPGEIVYAAGGLSVRRADDSSREQIIGVVSTKPGLTLGFDDTPTGSNESGYAVALSGRVPIKLSTENGPIAIGDQIALSSISGVGMKARPGDIVVGSALESFDGSYAYSEGFVNQFGDDIRIPNTTPHNLNADPRINDGCSFGGGGAIGTAPCMPSVAGASTDEADESEAAVETAEETLEEIEDLTSIPAESMSTASGTVAVGKVLMFVKLGRFDDIRTADVMRELLATSTDIVFGGEGESLWDRLKTLAQNFVDGVLSVTRLKADSVEIKDQLCVDDVCVTADDLRELLQGNGSGTPPPPDPEPEPEPSSPPEEGTAGGGGGDEQTEEVPLVTEETTPPPEPTPEPSPEPQSEPAEPEQPEEEPEEPSVEPPNPEPAPET